MADASGGVGVGVVIDATDRTGPGFASASKNADLLQKKFQGLGSTVKAMPEHFGKASTALLLFQNSTSQMGGKVADAANKMTALAGIIATGGPIGIAIAALTVATMGITALYERWGAESKRLAEKQKEASEYIKKIREETEKQAQATNSAREALENFGKTARQVRINQLKQELALADAQYNRYEKFIDQVYEAERAGRKLTEEESIGLQKKEAKRAELLALIGEYSSEIKALEDLTEKEKEKTKATESATKAQREQEKAVGDFLAVARKLDAQYSKSKTKAAEARAETIAIMERQFEEERELRGRRLDEELQAEELIAQNRREAGEEHQRMLEKQKTEAAELEAVHKSVATSIASSMGNAWAQVALGQMEASEAMKLSLIDAAVTAINAYAASGAAAAAFSQAGIPILGPVLAAGGAAFLSALIKGYLADIPSAERGLSIPGRGGGESLFHTMRTDETVLDPQSTMIWLGIRDAVREMARGNGGSAGHAMGGGTVVNNFNERTVFPNTSAVYKRQIRDAKRQLSSSPSKVFARAF